MTTEETKVCPFCAETIKAAATVCRFCGRDLVAPASPTGPATSDDRQLLDREMAAYTQRGWMISSQGPTSFQATQQKQWNRAGVVLFVALPLLLGLFWLPGFGIAVFGLLLVVADYLLKKETTKFVTLDDIRQAIANPGVARIQPNGSGGYTCSACGGGIREDAKVCKHCKKPLIVGAVVYAASKPPSPPTA